MPSLPRVRPEDAITADLFNALIEAANRCNLEIGPGLKADQGPDGTILSAIVPRTFWAKITGAPTSGLHPWTEQFPAAGGTWTAGTRTGTAREVNASTDTLTNKYVEVWWSVAGYYEFRLGNCP